MSDPKKFQREKKSLRSLARIVTITFLVVLVSACVFRAVERRERRKSARELALVQVDAFGEDDPRRELAALERQREKNPHSAFLWGEIARINIVIGRVTREGRYSNQAEEAARESLRLMPVDNIVAKEALARALLHRHSFQDVVAISRELRDRGSYQACDAEVSALLELGQNREALALAQEFRATTPTFEARMSLGAAEEAAGDPGAAERAYIEAIRGEVAGTRGASLWARSVLARLYIRTERFDEAAIILNGVLNVEPNYAFAVGLEGERLLHLKQPNRAIDQFSKAFLLSRDPIYLLFQARAMNLAGKEDAGRLMLDSLIALYAGDVSSDGRAHRVNYAEALLERASHEDVALAITVLEEEQRVRRSSKVQALLERAHQLARQPEALVTPRVTRQPRET